MKYFETFRYFNNYLFYSKQSYIFANIFHFHYLIA